MYNEHFGLNRRPFRITPDTDLFFPGGRRGEILDALIYAITAGEGIVKVVGEVGSGKTMLCRMLELRLPDEVEVVYLANPSLTPADILHAIALEMGIGLAAEASRVQAMHALQRELLDKHAAGRRVVVLVEEAQGMPVATLEEIRLLSNLETKRDKLLQIALFGQPELDQLLERTEIRQLRERITYSFELEPLSTSEIHAYLTFRLRAVGYRGRDVFRKRAYAAMASASEGLTRRVNILADKALLAAYAEDAHDVARRHVKVAIQDSAFAHKRRSRAPELAVVLGLALLVSAVLWFGHGPNAGWWPFVLQAKVAAASRAPSVTAPAPVATPVAPAQGAAIATEVVSVAAPVTPILSESSEITATVGQPLAATTSDLSDQPEAQHDGVESPALKPETTVVVAAVPASTKSAAAPPRGLVLSERLVGSFAQPAEPQSELTPRDAPVIAPHAAPPSDDIAVADPVAPESSPASAPTAAPVTPRLPQAAQPPPAASESAPDATLTAPPPPLSATPRAEAPDSGADPLIAQRLAATHSWLRSVDGGYYSIQLMLTDANRRRNLEAFLRRRERAGDLQQIFVYQARIGRRARYGVLYGVYSTMSAARAALNELTPDLARYRPFIRNVRDVTSRG